MLFGSYSLIFQFPIYLETGSKYIGNWKMRVFVLRMNMHFPKTKPIYLLPFAKRVCFSRFSRKVFIFGLEDKVADADSSADIGK